MNFRNNPRTLRNFVTITLMFMLVLQVGVTTAATQSAPVNSASVDSVSAIS